MKTKFFFLMVFGALLFLGCSVDDEDELLVESYGTDITQNDTRAQMVTRPFKVRGWGTFQLVPNTVCDAPLVQVLIEGEGNATHLGRFDVTIDHCTDFATVFEFVGVQTAANGDELYFYAVGSGVDDMGQWTDYVYDGGTGRFEFATGELRLYGVLTYNDPTNPAMGGTYTNHGFGTITF